MTTAPLSQRFLAGLIDGAVLFIVSLAAFLGPLLIKGLVVPMWGVLLAIIGLQVVPLAFLKQTLGYRIVGLQLVNAEGHAVDLANVLFRELIGRGLFPLAYLYTVAGGLFARLLHLVHFEAPVGLAALLFLASGLAVVAAVVGHVMALRSTDERTLADLMARSYVVPYSSDTGFTDEADQLEAREALQRTTRKVRVFQALTLLAIAALPWALTVRVGESADARIARVKREGLQARFERDPANHQLAQELRDALQREGLNDAADQVIKRFAEAQKKRDAEREVSLRRQLTDRPHDGQVFAALLELLENQDRLDEARDAYLQYLGPAMTPSQRGGFAHWLASVNRDDESAAQFQQALTADPLIPMGHTMYGILLARMNRPAEAQRELFLALLDDPTDEDAMDSMQTVTSQLGPLAPDVEKSLRQQYDTWSKAAEAAAKQPQP